MRPANSIDELLEHMVERDASDLHVTTLGRPLSFACVEKSSGSRSSRRSRRSRHAAAPLPHPLERAAEALRAEAPAGLLALDPRARPLPRQRLLPARVDRRGLSSHPHRDQDARGARASPPRCTSSRKSRAASCSSPARPAPASRRRSPPSIDEINRTRSEHILTIEDPIEFLHRHKRCIVNQREIGPDAVSLR